MSDAEHPPKRRFFSLTRRILLLIMLVAVFAVYYTNFSLKQHSRNQQQSDEVVDVKIDSMQNTILRFQKHFDELDDKINKLAQAGPAQNNGNNEEARIAALEKELAVLKANPTHQLNAVTAQPENNEELFQAIHLLSAFYRLSNKVMAGKPFAAELSAFTDLDADEAKSEAITGLAPYADTGIPTFAILLASFDDSVEQLTAAQSVPPTDASWWDKFLFNLSHLVSIRKVDANSNEKTTEAIIGRAQIHLEREEIEAAEAEIKTLPDDIRGNFAAWVEEAQIVLDAPSFLDQIQEQVLQTAFHTEAKPADAKAAKP